MKLNLGPAKKVFEKEQTLRRIMQQKVTIERPLNMMDQLGKVFLSASVLIINTSKKNIKDDSKD